MLLAVAEQDATLLSVFISSKAIYSPSRGHHGKAFSNSRAFLFRQGLWPACSEFSASLCACVNF